MHLCLLVHRHIEYLVYGLVREYKIVEGITARGLILSISP